MRLLLLLAFTLSVVQLHAQKSPKFTYLVLAFVEDWDYEAKKNFVKILPQPANPHAKKLYDLVPFINERSVTNNKGNYYPAIGDSTLGIYNYFANQSQVLQFVADEGWELVQVVQQIGSKPETELVRDNWQVYTKITTRPVFYLRKTIE